MGMLGRAMIGIAFFTAGFTFMCIGANNIQAARYGWAAADWLMAIAGMVGFGACVTRNYNG